MEHVKVLSLLREPQAGDRFLLLQLDTRAVRYCVLGYSNLWKLQATAQGTIDEWGACIDACLNCYDGADGATWLLENGVLIWGAEGRFEARVDNLIGPLLEMLRAAGLLALRPKVVIPFVGGQGLKLALEPALREAFPAATVAAALPALKPAQWEALVPGLCALQAPAVPCCYRLIAVKLAGQELAYDPLTLFEQGDDPHEPRPIRLHTCPHDETVQLVVTTGTPATAGDRVPVALALAVRPADGALTATARFEPGTDGLVVAVKHVAEVKQLKLEAFELPALPAIREQREGIDLAFLLDATLPEAQFDQARALVRAILGGLDECNVPLRLALVAFGDYEAPGAIDPPRFVVVSHEFTTGRGEFERQLAAQERTPGWDVWDALEMGLQRAAALRWERARRILVAIGNSPPHRPPVAGPSEHYRFARADRQAALRRLQELDVRRYAYLAPLETQVAYRQEIEGAWQEVGSDCFCCTLEASEATKAVQSICADNPPLHVLTAPLGLPLTTPWPFKAGARGGRAPA